MRQISKIKIYQDICARKSWCINNFMPRSSWDSMIQYVVPRKMSQFAMVSTALHSVTVDVSFIKLSFTSYRSDSGVERITLRWTTPQYSVLPKNVKKQMHGNHHSTSHKWMLFFVPLRRTRPQEILLRVSPQEIVLWASLKQFNEQEKHPKCQVSYILLVTHIWSFQSNLQYLISSMHF